LQIVNGSRDLPFKFWAPPYLENGWSQKLQYWHAPGALTRKMQN